MEQMIIPTRPGYYIKATDGRSLRITLAQTATRAAELMAADIKRFDPFQHRVVRIKMMKFFDGDELNTGALERHLVSFHRDEVVGDMEIKADSETAVQLLVRLRDCFQGTDIEQMMTNMIQVLDVVREVASDS